MTNSTKHTFEKSGKSYYITNDTNLLSTENKNKIINYLEDLSGTDQIIIDDLKLTNISENI